MGFANYNETTGTDRLLPTLLDSAGQREAWTNHGASRLSAEDYVQAAQQRCPKEPAYGGATKRSPKERDIQGPMGKGFPHGKGADLSFFAGGSAKLAREPMKVPLPSGHTPLPMEHSAAQLPPSPPRPFAQSSAAPMPSSQTGARQHSGGYTPNQSRLSSKTTVATPSQSRRCSKSSTSPQSPNQSRLPSKCSIVTATPSQSRMVSKNSPGMVFSDMPAPPGLEAPTGWLGSPPMVPSPMAPYGAAPPAPQQPAWDWQQRQLAAAMVGMGGTFPVPHMAPAHPAVAMGMPCLGPAALAAITVSLQEALHKEHSFPVAAAHTEPSTCDDAERKRLEELLETASPQERLAFAQSLCGRVGRMSTDPNGCWVVQKAMQVLPVEGQLLLFVDLVECIEDCIESKHGNFVVQVCIEQLPPGAVVPVIEAVACRAKHFSTHRYGCRVVQRLLEHCSPMQVASITGQVIDGAVELATNQYGCHVLRCALTYCQTEDQCRIVQAMRINISKLSKNRLASLVIERCLEVAKDGDTPSQLEGERQALVRAILFGDGEAQGSESQLSVLASTRFGRGILRRVLAYAVPFCSDDEREMLRYRLYELLPAETALWDRLFSQDNIDGASDSGMSFQRQFSGMSFQRQPSSASSGPY